MRSDLKTSKTSKGMRETIEKWGPSATLWGFTDEVVELLTQ